MSRVQGITFNYKLKNDDKIYHYSCRFLTKENILNKNNPMAPTLNTKIFNIKYRTKPLDTEAGTVLTLIEFICENGIKTKPKRQGLIRHANYERKEIYELTQILSYVLPETTEDKESKVDFDGDYIKMNSQRYSLFKKSHICCCCGLKGQYFAKERIPKSDKPFYHLNLYGNLNNREILFTKDHIKPKSMGGEDSLNNYQTMCLECNNLKGNDEISLSKLRERVAIYRKQVYNEA